MNLFKSKAEKEFKVDIISSEIMELSQNEWQAIIKGRPYWAKDNVKTINFAKFLCYYTAKKACILSISSSLNPSYSLRYLRLLYTP